MEWNGTDWIQVGADIDGEAGGDQFGLSVAITADGSRVMAGAILNSANGQWSGHARVFDWDGTNWDQVGMDIDGDMERDQLGVSVALNIDGSTAAVGAFRNDAAGNQAGLTRAFSLPINSSWSSLSNGNWDTGTNWTVGSEPDANTNALIDGAVTVTIGTNAFANSLELANGAHLIINGNLTILDINDIIIPANCIISGSGTINGDIQVNGGDFSAGNSPGQIILNGDFEHLTGTFNVEIDGITPGTQYDQLVASGAVSIDNNAQLNIVFGGGFQPTGSETFDIITANSITGTYNESNISFSGGNVSGVSLSYPNGNKVQLTAIIPFITTWETTAPNESITIPTLGGGYNYDVAWGDGNTSTSQNGDATHVYANAGTYSVSITGDFPRIYFNDSGDKDKIQSIDNWGSIAWTNMGNAFQGCTNLTYAATDAPDLSAVTNMNQMFAGATSFNGNLNNWNTSTITTMVNLFSGATSFNQPLNNWDVSNVTAANGLFLGASAFNSSLSGWVWTNLSNGSAMFRDATAFNQDISSWDFSQNNTSGIDLSILFANASAFNQPLNAWDVSNVTNMRGMFSNATAFNQALNNWEVSKVTTMETMFFGASAFNSSLAGWDLTSVNTTRLMFRSASAFNQPIDSWVNTGGISNMFGMFLNASVFNQSLNSWDVSGATNMAELFLGAFNFNQPLNNWNVSGVTNMSGMFRGAAAFNSSLSGWVLTALTNADRMFESASAFNQDISTWDFTGNTTAGITFNMMLSNASSFNQPLNSWDVSNVIEMKQMFANTAAFNQPLNSWVVTKVTSMENMFANASVFDQDLGGWDISLVTNMTDMLTNSGLSTINYDKALIGWQSGTVQQGVTLGASGVQYCGAETERQALMDPPNNWTINDAGQSCRVQLRIRGLLQGPFTPLGPELMADDLRAQGLIPTTSPYPDALTCDPSVFNLGTSAGTGKANSSIVDWVCIELRDATNSNVVVASRSALIRRDGRVVDVDGVTHDLVLTADPANNYFVVLKHRSHNGVMTATAIQLN